MVHLNTHFAEERERLAKDRVKLAQERDQAEKDYERMVKERYRIAKERDVASNRMTKQRDQSWTTIFDMTKTMNGVLERLQPRPRVGQRTQTSPRPERQANAAPQIQSQAKDPNKLWYCDICRKSVNSLDNAVSTTPKYEVSG